VRARQGRHEAFLLPLLRSSLRSSPRRGLFGVLVARGYVTRPVGFAAAVRDLSAQIHSYSRPRFLMFLDLLLIASFCLARAKGGVAMRACE